MTNYSLLPRGHVRIMLSQANGSITAIFHCFFCKIYLNWNSGVWTDMEKEMLYSCVGSGFVVLWKWFLIIITCNFATITLWLEVKRKWEERKWRENKWNLDIVLFDWEWKERQVFSPHVWLSGKREERKSYEHSYHFTLVPNLPQFFFLFHHYQLANKRRKTSFSSPFPSSHFLSFLFL